MVEADGSDIDEVEEEGDQGEDHDDPKRDL